MRERLLSEEIVVEDMGGDVQDVEVSATKKIGLDMDLTARGLGVRSKRYAMSVDNGVVKVLNIEEAPGAVTTSSAETLCSMVDRSL